MDAVKNFGFSAVSALYDAAAVQITVANPERFPNPATDGEFNLVWFNSIAYQHPAEDPYAEIVRVTAKSGSVLTITRAQESTLATAKNQTGASYSVMLAFTKKQYDDFVSAIDAKIPLTQKGAASGVAELDADAKVPLVQLPAITISDTFVVASEAAMLALVAETGDVAIRTDLSKTFILAAEPASVLANWKEMLNPPAAVLSVFGRIGAIVAQDNDYNAGQILETLTRVFVTPDEKTAITHANRAELDLVSGTNTGDETVDTIKAKLGFASADTDGYLTMDDWKTFNNKQDALGYTPEQQLTFDNPPFSRVGNTISFQYAATDVYSQYLLRTGRAGGQIFIGGTNVTDTAIIQGTSGNGTLTAAAIILKVGNNGGTTALTVLNNGKVGIGGTPTVPLHVYGGFISNLSGYTITHSLGGTNALSFTGNSSLNSSGSFYISASSGYIMQTTTGSLSLQALQSSTGYFNVVVGPLYRMWVDKDGRWGGNNITAPSAFLHLPAGLTTAGYASLKFTSGALLSTAEAGAISFVTDKLSLGISTGPAWKEFALNDIALTSGRVPFVTTNGRLTDSANLLYDGSYFQANGYKSADGSAGVNGTFVSADGTPKTITVKNGLVTSIV